MTVPFERFKQFVGDDGKLTLDATSFLEELAQPQDWIEVTPQGTGGNTDFQNSWANVGGTDAIAAFYKDPFDRVYGKGRVDSGSVNTIIYTLPEGYRPSESYIFAAMQSTSAVKLHVSASGNVQTTGAVSNALQSVIFSFRAL